MPNRRTRSRGRLELQADPAWVDFVKDAAGRMGEDLSSYVRAAVTRQLQADGFAGIPPALPSDKKEKA